MILVTPPLLSLIGLQGKDISGEVEITAKLDKPLVLQPGTFNLAEKMTYTVVEVKKGKKFMVRFKSSHPLSEALDGYLNLRTNYPEKPEITIFIQCRMVFQSS